MGRRRIEIALLPTARARQVTFYKRKAGFIKKAKELACLTGAKIYLEVKFGNRMTRLGSPCPPEPGVVEQNLPLEMPAVPLLSPGSVCSSSTRSSPPVPSPQQTKPTEDIFYVPMTQENTFNTQDFTFPSFSFQPAPQNLPPQPNPTIDFSSTLPPFYQLAQYSHYNNTNNLLQ